MRPVVALAALLLMPLAASADAELEYKVKAAFLVNFTRFVSWPPEKFGSTASPLEICVLGDGRIAEILENYALGKRVGDRSLAVRTAERPEALRACHVVYVQQSSGLGTAQLAVLAGASVLTVYESPETQPQGVIRFLIDDGKVRFEVNVAAAERESLRLSAKLLGVARVVAR